MRSRGEVTKVVKLPCLSGRAISSAVRGDLADCGLWCLEPLKSKVLFSDETPPVWPHADGPVRGSALLYWLHWLLQNLALYRLLALFDALRIGQAREREMARKLLEKTVGLMAAFNNPNLAILELVAQALGPVCEREILWGAVPPVLLLTQRQPDRIRITEDVDIVAQALTVHDYRAIEKPSPRPGV